MKYLLLAIMLIHNQWADGGRVPPWIKSMCCGEADAHQLGPEDYTSEEDGYHIKGLDHIVPFKDVIPSQDGQWWAFWNENLGPGATIYCFFAPLGA